MIRNFFLTFRIWRSPGNRPVLRNRSGHLELRRKMDQLTDFEVELDRIDKAIAELGSNALSSPIDSERATKFVYLVYQRASLSGSLRALEDAEAALNTAIQHLGPAGDLYFLKANIDFKFHRLGAVRLDLETGRDLIASPQGRALLCDLGFQEGRYD